MYPKDWTASPASVNAMLHQGQLAGSSPASSPCAPAAQCQARLAGVVPEPNEGWEVF